MGMCALAAGLLALLGPQGSGAECQWASVPQGPDGSVLALFAHDAGGADSLFAGGSFSSAGGGFARNVARFDGALWYPLGAGTNGPVHGFARTDLGAGEQLVVFGDFTSAGGVPAPGLAFWDGLQWSAPAAGLDIRPSGAVHYDTPFGPRLVVGGRTDPPGDQCLAVYDGATWSAHTFPGTSLPSSLAVHDVGAGPEVWIADSFSVLRWSGGAIALHTFHSLAVPGRFAQLPGDPALYLGAEGWIAPGPQAFPVAQGDPLSRVTAAGIEAAVPNLAVASPGTSHAISALAPWNGPAGPVLVAAGSFTHANGTWFETSRVAARATAWVEGESVDAFLPVGSGLLGAPRALCAASLGGIEWLFAAGDNLASAGAPLGGLARIAPCAGVAPATSIVHGCDEDPAPLGTWYDVPQVGAEFQVALPLPFLDFLSTVRLYAAVSLELGPAGCGVPIAGVGPLLLKGLLLGGAGLPPSQAGFYGFAPETYLARWYLPLPNLPALLGNPIAFQALILRPSTGTAGLTRALLATPGW